MRHLCGLEGVIVQRSMCVAAVFPSRLTLMTHFRASKATSFAGHEVVFIRLCGQSCQLQFRSSNRLGGPSLFGSRGDPFYSLCWRPSFLVVAGRPQDGRQSAILFALYIICTCLLI